MKLVRQLIFLLLAVFVLITGCKKSNKDNTAPVGALGPNYPYALNNILTPAILDTLKKHGAIIHDGLTPPAVSGIFYEHPQYCLFDNSSDKFTGKIFDDYLWKFSNQNTGAFTIQLNYKDISAGGSDIGADNTATYVSGSGNFFTVFAKTAGNTAGVNYISLQVISGELQSNGTIKNFQNSFYFVSKDPDPQKILTIPGTLRIFLDQDGISTAQTTFSVNPIHIQSIGGEPNVVRPLAGNLSM